MHPTVRQLVAWEWLFSVSRFACPFVVWVWAQQLARRSRNVSQRAAPFSATLRTCQGDKQNGQRGLPPFPGLTSQKTPFPRPWSSLSIIVNVLTVEHSGWQNVSLSRGWKKMCIKSTLRIVHKKLPGWKMFGCVNVPRRLVFSYRTSDLGAATWLSLRTESPFSLPRLLEELENMRELTV